MSVDEAKLETFMDQAVGDLGAAISGVLVYLGDQLGLYKAMAGAGPLRSAEVAGRAGCDVRYVREWLGNQAAGGYVVYDPDDETYELPDGRALPLAAEDSPAFIWGAYRGIVPAYNDAARFADAFRTGRGVGWHEHAHRLFPGTERFFKPAYVHNLTSTWIPSLDGVEERLRQ